MRGDAYWSLVHRDNEKIIQRDWQMKKKKSECMEKMAMAICRSAVPEPAVKLTSGTRTDKYNKEIAFHPLKLWLITFYRLYRTMIQIACLPRCIGRGYTIDLAKYVQSDAILNCVEHYNE